MPKKVPKSPFALTLLQLQHQLLLPLQSILWMLWSCILLFCPDTWILVLCLRSVGWLPSPHLWLRFLQLSFLRGPVFDGFCFDCAVRSVEDPIPIPIPIPIPSPSTQYPIPKTPPILKPPHQYHCLFRFFPPSRFVKSKCRIVKISHLLVDRRPRRHIHKWMCAYVRHPFHRYINIYIPAPFRRLLLLEHWKKKCSDSSMVSYGSKHSFF